MLNLFAKIETDTIDIEKTVEIDLLCSLEQMLRMRSTTRLRTYRPHLTGLTQERDKVVAVLVLLKTVEG